MTTLLAEIQKNLKAPKGQFNKFGNYKYRSCEDILEAVKQVLPKDCAVSISDEIVMVGDRYYVKATATLMTPQTPISCTAYAREEESKKGMDGAQVTGAASSYARKYALNGLFAIDDTKDSDVTNTHGKEPAKETPKGNLSSECLKLANALKNEDLKTKVIQSITKANGNQKELERIYKKLQVVS